MTILVTGGAGFIGSHSCVELLNNGYNIVAFDNYNNSSPEVFENIKKITNKDFVYLEADMLDKDVIRKIFDDHKIDLVMHFAGHKAVGESVEFPLMYYINNIQGTLNLLDIMREKGVLKMVFSSSATVYGDPASVPVEESFPLFVTNPYGRTKLMIEDILRDLYQSDNSWSIVLLRYFNPVGSHGSYLIGENPKGIPNNVMPVLIEAATKKREFIDVFGSDYPTPDGTGIRDYIHVVDLARGHVKASDFVIKNKGIEAINLGTGRGYSVLELINTFKSVNNIDVPYSMFSFLLHQGYSALFFIEKDDDPYVYCYTEGREIEKTKFVFSEYVLAEIDLYKKYQCDI